MYETILVATDGSGAAEAALEHAIDLAESAGGTVHVLAVVDAGSNPLRFGVNEIEAIDRAAADLIEDVVTAYEHRDIQVTGDVRRGRPAESIVEYAESIDADAILAGQRGEDGLEERLLGSTTDRIARATTVPLIIVPDPRTDKNSD